MTKCKSLPENYPAFNAHFSQSYTSNTIIHKVFMSMQLTLRQTLAIRHFSTPGMFKNRVVRVFRTLV